MKFFAVVLSVFLLTSCITLTDEEKLACAGAEEGAAACEANLIEKKKEDMQYAIEERNAEHYDQYLEFAVRCRRAGGAVWVERKGPGPTKCRGRDLCPPRWGDTYGCTKF